MQSKPVGWFEIYVQDLGRAQAFYEAVFEFEMASLPAPDNTLQLLAFPGPMDDSHGCSGALVKMEGGPSGGGSSIIIYFMCKDCAVEAGRVEAAGGQLFKPKFSIGQYGFAALAVDTEGNMIGLHSMQ
ncbi:MAG: lactoylglutathione lyase [Rhodoferax sp.]|nr:lactoylglutathione lyase [Rhodoferax sp.]